MFTYPAQYYMLVGPSLKTLALVPTGYHIILCMMNHIDILCQELKKVLPNIPKKHTNLRKEIQKTVDVFESSIPVFPYQVCTGMLRLFGESQSSSCCVSVFPFMQAIINLGFVNDQLISEMLDLMIRMRGMQHFSATELQMRLQQLTLLMISKQWISFKKIQFVQKLFDMILSLENPKNPLLKRNSIASLIQILVLLMNETREDSSHVDGLHRVLKEFLLMTDGIKPNWLPEGIPIDREVVSHVLSQILQEPLFKDHLPKYQKLLLSIMSVATKNLFQLMHNTGQPVSPSKERRDHYTNLHLSLLLYYRILTRASKILGKQFEFLEEINRNIVHQESFAVRILSHQVMSSLFNDHRWLHNLLVSPQCEIFFHLLNTELNEARNICLDKKLDLATPYEGMMRHLMVINDYDIFYPDYTAGLQLKMIVKDLEEITFSFYSIYQQIFQIPLEKRFSGQMPLHKLFLQYHKGVIQMVKVILPRDISEGLLQSVLKIIQKLINLSGCFGDSKVCGMYIKAICKYCLPSQFVAIDYRHVQIHKMVLNTANCLGNLLDTPSWIIIWKALQNYQAYYNKYLQSKENNQYFHQRQNDVQILYQSIDSIFTESVSYEDDYLMVVIDSLIQVTYQCLENSFTENDKKIFSFQRIGQIYKLNLKRCCLIWPSLSSSLLCITTSKVSNFRSSALALLNRLIPLTLSHLSSHQEDLSGKFTKDNYQKVVFEPWTNLVKCNFPELKDQIAQSLDKILIDYGHILDQGWLCILEITRDVRDFKSLQVIVETFLDKLDVHLELLVDIVHQFKKDTVDANQKYLCLTFLWNIGDYACTVDKVSIFQKIFSILLQPEYPFVFNPEARHSAFYIFTQLLIHNCQGQTIQFWGQNFKVIQVYIDFILAELSRVTDPKIVEEAGKNILVNLIKIYKKYFIVLEKQQTPKDYQLQLFFSFVISLIRLKNIDLYVVTLKQIKEILNIKMDQLLRLPKFKEMLTVLNQVYEVTDDLKVMKCLISYIPPDVFDILIKCLPNIQGLYPQVYRLMERMFLIRLEAEAKDMKLQSSRIFFEQKLVFEFIRTLFANCKSNPELLVRFSGDLVNTLQKQLEYQDYVCLGKNVPIIKDIVGLLDQMDVVKRFLSFLTKLAKLKYNVEVLKRLNTSKQMPIWSIATQELMQISNDWIKTNALSKSLLILEQIRQIQEVSQPQSSLLVQILNQPNLEFYFSNEITLMNYLLQEFILSEKFQIQDSYIQSFAQTLYSRSKIDDLQSNIASYSRTNYELLFKFSAREGNLNLVKRVAVIYVFLVVRIKETFQQYLDLERRFGTLPSNQKIVNQIVFVLNRMQRLRLIEGINKHIGSETCQKHNLNSKLLESSNPLLLGEFSHFLYFHQNMTQLIKAKDSSIRQALAAVFQAMGTVLLQ